MAKSALIVGASRGLGLSLAKIYLRRGYDVWASARKRPQDPIDHALHWISNVDIATPTGPTHLTSQLPKNHVFDTIIITAGVFSKETFDAPDFDAEVRTYTTCAIGPLFVAQSLVHQGHLSKGSKLILVSSEAGSIALRHESEGGGMYSHHGSKAALNMVGRLLSFDLKDKEIAVGMVHPGFMRTDMTRNVGFDQFWDSGGAVTPDEAAASLADWIEHHFDMSKSGQYWAPRGPADIGTAEKVLGSKETLSTPLQLPW